MNLPANLSAHAESIADGSIIANYERRLALWERIYDAAATLGNYEVMQYAGQRITQLRTALVLHGARESGAEIDREASRERRIADSPMWNASMGIEE